MFFKNKPKENVTFDRWNVGCHLFFFQFREEHTVRFYKLHLNKTIEDMQEENSIFFYSLVFPTCLPYTKSGGKK